MKLKFRLNFADNLSINSMEVHMNYRERLYQEIESRKHQLKTLEKKGDVLTCSRISKEIEMLSLEFKRYTDFETQKTTQVYSSNHNH